MSWQLIIEEVLVAVKGELLNSQENSFAGVSTDSREDLRGKIFIALKGDQFDGHDFILEAINNGASAIIVHQYPATTQMLPITVIKVIDTLRALQQLANWWRRKNNFRVIGITGSNGKTTTKEFTRQLLSSKFKVHYAKGSFNNHWGLPLSILSATSECQIAVVEMGMNHPGELTQLMKIAEPDIVICTTVGRAHMGYFSSMEEIAQAKEEIYVSSYPDTEAIFNFDNMYTRLMYENFKKTRPHARVHLFSVANANADVLLKCTRATLHAIEVAGEIGGIKNKVEVPVFGSHNAINLAAAAAIGITCGMSGMEIWQGLPNCHSTWGRNLLIEKKNRPTILFDAYNANPDSMQVLLTNVKQIKFTKKKVGIFGEMLELGDFTEQTHEELGFEVATCGFAVVWFIGQSGESFAKGLKKGGYTGKVLTDSTQINITALQLLEEVGAEDLVVIKGSRGMKMERILAAWSIDLPK